MGAISQPREERSDALGYGAEPQRALKGRENRTGWARMPVSPAPFRAAMNGS